jgi:hypothetical protein
MLPGSASDLEHKAAPGQRLFEDFRDRPLVALRRRADEAPFLKIAQRLAPRRRLILAERSSRFPSCPDERLNPNKSFASRDQDLVR